MSENNNRQDFSTRRPPPVGSVSAAIVPRYVLYGEDGERPDWFVNVEHLDERCRERGWTIAPHTHPHFMQVMLCTHGGGDMTIEGETHAFRPGSVMIVPAFCIHGFRYADNTQGWVLTVANTYLADLLHRIPGFERVVGRPGVFDMPAGIGRGLDADFARLFAELRDRRTGYAIGAQIHVMAILLQFLRHWPSADADTPARGSRQRIVARFKAIVEERFRDQPTMPAIAAELGVSPSQLRSACNGVAGISPVGILHDRILAEAQRCLAYTGMSVSEIADWLGFSDAAYFSRFFSRRTRETPTAYRRARQIDTVPG